VEGKLVFHLRRGVLVFGADEQNFSIELVEPLCVPKTSSECDAALESPELAE
jgi:hypothetical protein